MLRTVMSESASKSLSNTSIMIVEDDPEVSESLSLALTSEGYDVLRFAGAQEALDHLERAASPDLILLDLLMPNMNGWEFRMRQRGQPAWAEVPVVVMSADTSAQAAAIHADAFLAKPIETSTLLSTVDGVLSIVRRKRAEEHNAELERMSALGIVAAGVAHEINNPLAFVVGNLELARKHVSTLVSQLGPAQRAELLHVEELMKRADLGAARIAEIVRSVSTYSRPDTHTETNIDVVEVLEESIQLVENELRHRATLARDYGDVAPVYGNAAKLGQVFLNLLTNAAHALGECVVHAPQVRVTASTTPDGQVEVAICDNGPGISPALLRRLFEPFVSTKPHGAGLGLGLAISQRVIAGMGGTLTVDSALAKGTTFRLQLPASLKQQERLERAAPLPGPKPDGGLTPKVLVIDDEPMMCDLLARMLEPDYDVHVQGSPRDALSGLLAGQTYDVILCDLMMPELSGMDLHGQLARARPDQAARIVFMTGGTFTARSQAFLETLEGGYLAKPFRPPEVLAVIEERLGALGLVASASRLTH